MKLKKALSFIAIAIMTITLVQAQSDKIKKFESIAGKFKIQFTKIPAQTNNVIDLQDGKKSTMYQFSEETSTKASMISYNDYPESIMASLVIDDALKNAMKGFVKSLELTITSQKDVLVYRGSKSYKCLLYKASKKDMYCVVKVIIVGNRMYQIVEMNIEKEVSETDINNFIGSFELL